MYIHCPVAADSRLGCSRLSTTLSRSILVESRKQTKFPVARQGGGGWVPWVEGVRCLLHMGQAGHSSKTHLCTSLAQCIKHYCMLNGSDGSAYIQLFSCRIQTYLLNFIGVSQNSGFSYSHKFSTWYSTLSKSWAKLLQ